MAKAGSAYEKLVADVVSTMSPGAKVQYGQWTIGPDGGRRDLDVEIRGEMNGEDQFVVIECKDWKDSVGIGVVDALDSKRRDINADYALICSNSGFTIDALRKGKRVGIGMVSVLKSTDPRVKVVIEEEIYTKEIIIEECKSTCCFPDSSSSVKLPKDIKQNDIKYNHLPVVNWVAEKCIGLAGLNMSMNATEIVAHYKFREPILFDFGSVTLPVNAYKIYLRVKNSWTSQVISVGASKGIYDFIRHRTIMSAGQQQYKLIGVDLDKWKPIYFIPAEVPLESNTSKILLAKMNNIDTISGVGKPDIDRLIVEETITVDGKVLQKASKPPVKKDPKPASGIEMLTASIQGQKIKLGRNEPCFCGSGKKYKKCHWR